MATVFISYSRSNADFARRLADDLKRLDIDYWLDVDRIQAGQDWDDAVWQGLQSCELLLLVLSPSSMSSKEVSNEWKYHLSQSKPIIPVLVDPSTNIHYRLASLQYIDFHNNAYEAALHLLQQEIARVAQELGVSVERTENGQVDDSSAAPRDKADPSLSTHPLPDVESRANMVWDRTTTRIDPAMAKQLEERLHYFSEKMVLEFTSYEQNGLSVQARVGRDRDYIVGRAGKGVTPDVDLTPLGAADQGISRKHAALRVDGETLFIKDLNSTNFTYVEGKRLRGNEQLALKSGDRLQFGNLLLTIHFRDE